MRKVIIGIFILASLVECKKEENKSVAKIDFRDKIVGHYITSTFRHSEYPIPPNQFVDSTIYYNDTVELLVEKLITDSVSIIIMNDTLTLYNKTDSSSFFLTGLASMFPPSKWAHSANFFADSLILTYGEGGSPVSYSSHGWKGKKK